MNHDRIEQREATPASRHDAADGLRNEFLQLSQQQASTDIKPKANSPINTIDEIMFTDPFAEVAAKTKSGDMSKSGSSSVNMQDGKDTPAKKDLDGAGMLTKKEQTKQEPDGSADLQRKPIDKVDIAEKQENDKSKDKDQIKKNESGKNESGKNEEEKNEEEKNEDKKNESKNKTENKDKDQDKDKNKDKNKDTDTDTDTEKKQDITKHLNGDDGTGDGTGENSDRKSDDKKGQVVNTNPADVDASKTEDLSRRFPDRRLKDVFPQTPNSLQSLEVTGPSGNSQGWREHVGITPSPRETGRDQDRRGHVHTEGFHPLPQRAGHDRGGRQSSER